MKGKLAFVLGAAVGYVLGSRAGRERYEQLKRSAEQLWETDSVQRGVKVVQDAVDVRVGDLKDIAKRVGGDVLNTVTRKNGSGTGTSSGGSRAERSEPSHAGRAESAAKSTPTSDASDGSSAAAADGAAGAAGEPEKTGGVKGAKTSSSGGGSAASDGEA